ncbi:MAG: hypothetical protein WCI36_05330 [bacterium]
MKQKQKRRKIARIRKKQKMAKLAKRRKPMTHNDLENHTAMIESFMHSDEEIIIDFSAKIEHSKKLGSILSPILILLGLAMGWESGFVFLGILLAFLPWLEYFLYRDSLIFWKKQLRENSKYLQDLKSRLAAFENKGGYDEICI